MYRSPLDVDGYFQFVAPQFHHFVKDGESLGRIIWRRLYEIEGIYIEKDEDYEINVDKDSE